MRVLIVDDFNHTAETMALLFEALGHEARAVMTAEYAIAAISSFNPELVFLDILTEDVDGYDLARRIREMRGHSVYLVAHSGLPIGSPRRPDDGTFDKHLFKPVSLNEIKETLSSAARSIEGRP